MKPLSKHIQETLTSNSLKGVFVEKLVDEELDALTRAAPSEKVAKSNTSSLLDSVVSEK
jgi:hypothetical protein